jgi:monofunctional biosynthetic peptidoglycan transglycosylase
MSTTDRTFPVPDNPAADAGSLPREPLPDDSPAPVPPANEESVPPAPSALALSADRRDAIANTPGPDVMSEFRCIAAAAPEPGWTGKGFDVFAPPPARGLSDERTEQAVESPAPEPAPSEPEPVARSREPDLEAEVVAAVDPQWEEPEPAVDTAMVPEPEPAADPPEAAQPAVDIEPPGVIEEPEPVVDTLAFVEPEAAAHSPEAAQPAVEAEPPVAIEAALYPAIADTFPASVEPVPLPEPARQPEPAWTLQGPAEMSAITTPVPAAAQRWWTRDELKAVGVRAAKVAGIVFTAWFCTVLFLIVVYRFINPPVSSLMVLRWLGGTKIERDWVPLARISPNLRRAVIVSEDGRFCSHWGIDFAEVAAAIKRTPNGVPRGASTISMQVTKNLFLWPAKSYVRKVIEVPLTYVIEMLWPKRRILEVYLNIAEWGPGIFGAEAASQYYFHKSAADLTRHEAVQLAAALPNPRFRNPAAQSRRALIVARAVERRMPIMAQRSGCVLPAR